MTKEKDIPVLALDTSVAVYIITGAKHEKNNQKKQFMAQLFAENKYEYVLPSPVIAEILSPIKLKKREHVKNLICRDFRIIDFDSKSAELAARIFSTNQQIKIKRNEQKARVKYDAQIVGASIRWGVDGLCTFDDKQKKKFNRLAKIVYGSATTRIAGGPETFIDNQLFIYPVVNDAKKQPVKKK